MTDKSFITVGLLFCRALFFFITNTVYASNDLSTSSSLISLNAQNFVKKLTPDECSGEVAKSKNMPLDVVRNNEITKLKKYNIKNTSDHSFTLMTIIIFG